MTRYTNVLKKIKKTAVTILLRGMCLGAKVKGVAGCRCWVLLKAELGLEGGGTRTRQ